MAVPVFDSPVSALQEPEKTALAAVPKGMATRLDGITGSDVLIGDTQSREPTSVRGFQSPFALLTHFHP